MDFAVIPKHILWNMFKALKTDGEFSEELAIISMLLDKMNGKKISQRGYVEIWHWGHKKIRTNWAKIDAISETCYREWLRAHKGHTKGTKNSENEPESKIGGTRRAHEGHTSNITNNNTLNSIDKTIPSLTNLNPSERSTRARGIDFPNEDEVVAYFTQLQITQNFRYNPVLEAQRFYMKYSAQDWMIGNTLIRDWQMKARGWLFDIRTGKYPAAEDKSTKRTGNENPNKIYNKDQTNEDWSWLNEGDAHGAG